MTTDDRCHSLAQHPDPDPKDELVHGQSLPSQNHQDYRQLEQHYRHSPQYAAMVARYPLLRHWINSCRNGELVGHPAAEPRQFDQADQADVILRWDRSHGEG